MCDYSLQGVASRRAKVGDKLITTEFLNTFTRGFSAVDDPRTAVCLLPGTELAFDSPVRRRRFWPQIPFFGRSPQDIRHKVGRFVQIDLDSPNTHHDAIEFPDGRIVLLTYLRAGQRATVLQLPARTPVTARERTEREIFAR